MDPIFRDARKFLPQHDVDVVVYHSPCNDGHASAALFYDHINDLTFHGLHPKDALLTPDVCALIKGKNVVFVDIAFSRDTMLEVAKLANRVLVLDHHVTNETCLKSLNVDNMLCIFQMDVPGVFLSWMYLYARPVSEMPTALYYIGLKDVWKHKDNKAAVYFMTAFERPDTWDGWLPYIRDESLVPYTIDHGMKISVYNDSVLKTMMEKVQYAKWRGYTIAMVNVPYPWISDIGALMCERDPENTIAVIWNKQMTGPYHVSLRTHNPRGPNVEVIAHEFNGGGHVHGAGLRLNRPPFEVFVENVKDAPE